jgi:hypothetical protein
MSFEVLNSKIVSTIPLIKKAIKIAMKLAKMTSLRFEVKTYVKSRVSWRFNQDQLGQRNDIFVVPNLSFLEFTEFVLKFLTEMGLLIKAWHPIETVFVNYFAVYSCFCFDLFICNRVERRDCRAALQPAHPEPHVADECPLRRANYSALD